MWPNNKKLPSVMTEQRDIHELLGRHQGIFKSLYITPPAIGDWPLYYGGAKLCDVGVLSGQQSFVPPAGGIGRTYTDAYHSVIGEGVERYCAAFKSGAVHRDASLEELLSGSSIQNAVIRPSDLSHFSAAQLQTGSPAHPQQLDKIKTEWIQAQSLFSDCPVWVPAPWVYLPYSRLASGLVAANSTGLACGINLEMSLANAIYEVIERDAYTLCWLFAGEPPQIKLPALPWVEEEIGCINHRNWSVKFYDLTGVENIPVVLTVLQGPAKGGSADFTYYTHGVASHLDPRIATIKSFREALLGYYYLVQRWREFAKTKSDVKEADPINFEQHALFYNYFPQRRDELGFLDKSGLVDWGHTAGTRECIAPDLKTLLAVLLEHSIQGAWVDLTTPEIKDYNLNVMRVLLSGFVWLHGDNRLPYLGTRRAQAPHQFYNYIPRFPNGVQRRNNWPHALG